MWDNQIYNLETECRGKPPNVTNAAISAHNNKRTGQFCLAIFAQNLNSIRKKTTYLA